MKNELKAELMRTHAGDYLIGFYENDSDCPRGTNDVIVIIPSESDIFSRAKAYESRVTDLREANREQAEALVTLRATVAEQARKFTELHALATELVNALGYWMNADQEPQDVYKAEMALGSYLVANAQEVGDAGISNR